MAGRKIHAGGKVYTPEEFVCEWCRTPLVLDTYYTIEGKNVCQSCRNKERCAVCGFLITESRYVTVDDKVYHPDCFRCSECLLELQKFHVVEGKLFCGDCLLLQAAERDPDSCCAKCFLPLSGSVLKALGNRYHEDCFVCHCCFKPFPNDEFVNIKGNPYCDECVNNESYLRSTAHLKATGQTGAGHGHGGSGSGHGAGGDRGLSSGAGGYGAGSPAHGSGGPGGYGAGGPGGAGGYGAGGPGGAGGYGSGSPAHGGPGGAGGYGAGGPGGAGGYGAGGPGGAGSGGPGSGGYSSSRGLDDGAGGPGGAGGYGSGGPGGYGSGGPGAGGPGGAGGYGSGGPGGAGGSGPDIRHRSAPEEDETVYAVNKYLDPSGLPPKGPSKYDSKFKAKLGGGMTEEKTKRDYKSKPALGYQNEAEHLKDLESLGYKTIRKK